MSRTPPAPESAQKAARPRRTVRLEVRLTEAESATLEAQAQEAGATVSDYVRARALGGRVVRSMATPERRHLIELLAQLGKLGSNLNQLAHHANATGGEYDRNGLSYALREWHRLVDRIHNQL